MTRMNLMAYTLSAALLAVVSHSGAARAQIDLPPDPLGDIAKIAETYRLEIVMADPSFPVRTTHGTINGKSAGKMELQAYVSLFCTEFGLYPPDLIARAQLKCVVLCRELSFADQLRNAIPDYEHDTLYLDVSRGTYSRNYLRKVIHHEFFHIIDYRDDGSVYQDERWETLNPDSFQYGSGGKAAQDIPQTSLLTDEFPGFLNHYSTTAVEEDKAELFANMIVDSQFVENRCRKDRVLNAKREQMKKLLLAFCSGMNETFWEKAAKVNRTGK